MNRYAVVRITPSGRPERLTTVYADNEAEAKEQAVKTLDQPGRRGILRQWQQSGAHVVVED
jgi:hypothetical protein